MMPPKNIKEYDRLVALLDVVNYNADERSAIGYLYRYHTGRNAGCITCDWVVDAHHYLCNWVLANMNRWLKELGNGK